MKTPQQIIDSLPEGNRKRACVIISETGSGPGLSSFWVYMECEAYAKAASYIEDAADKKATGKVFADMIWEG